MAEFIVLFTRMEYSCVVPNWARYKADTAEQALEAFAREHCYLTNLGRVWVVPATAAQLVDTADAVAAMLKAGREDKLGTLEQEVASKLAEIETLRQQVGRV